MKITHTTSGTCSRFIDIELDGEIIKEVRFIGGGAGNTRGVAALAAGLPVKEVIARTKRGKTDTKDYRFLGTRADDLDLSIFFLISTDLPLSGASARVACLY